MTCRLRSEKECEIDILEREQLEQRPVDETVAPSGRCKEQGTEKDSVAVRGGTKEERHTGCRPWGLY